MFFFFQAEDGIRDTSVTGVQTCALPIFLQERTHGLEVDGDETRERGLRAEALSEGISPRDPARGDRVRGGRDERSEERRVGRECRSRGWRYQSKKTTMR